ncbi:OpgC domain-containing protein [Piscinibacter sp. XHJ-5]|uniref:OpgC domain-containing protein n=1 Tax=Piscinibacter sp. XHJ-5 TaxID=3037797 RepID=UPI002452DA94|nr:OpgC domain-containing protein [Piscinibacter sp. XHJ-5]
MTAAPDAARRWEVDALRGLMLVLMTLTHMPTRWADALGQPFGFVSAAEGFVLLSGYMAGLVYTQRQRRDGDEMMRKAFLQRAVKVYACQVGLLLFLFTVISVIGVAASQPAVTDLLSFYLDEPAKAFLAGLALVYNPPLLDILPLYVLFLVLSPLLLLHGAHDHWGAILVGSVALWAGAQFGLGDLLYRLIAPATQVPVEQTGSFSVLAWQVLWVVGLWMGAREASGRPLVHQWPPVLVTAALVYALVSLAWRHSVGQVPTQPWAVTLFDKWHLGPARLLNVIAMLLLVLRFGPRLSARLGGMRVLETLGAASLPVFCAHLVLALLALALVGAPTASRPWTVDAAILLSTFTALYAVACVALDLDRRAASARRRWSARQASRQPATRSGVRR